MRHHFVSNSAEALTLVEFEWTVFHFIPSERNHKAALYGRMWKFRELGVDAMVRLVEGEHVLIARKEVNTYEVQ